MSSIYDFLLSEASSSTTGGVNAAENQDPSTVNDGMRALKQLLAAFVDDLGAVSVSGPGGTGDAITVTIASQISAYATGLLIAIKATAANTGAATINVTPSGGSALGAKKIRRKGDTALSANDMIASGVYLLRYDATYDSSAGAFVLLNPEAAVSAALTDLSSRWTAASASGAASLDFLEDSDNGTNKVTLKGAASTSDVTVTLPSTTGTVALTSQLPPFTAADATGAAYLDFAEDTDNGTNRVRLQGPASTADVTVTLPSTAGTVALTSDIPAAAAQSDQETATSTTTYVSPGRQQFHPSAAKCWGFVTYSAGTPTLQVSLNMTSITDSGVGLLLTTIATDFSSANYVTVVSAQNSANNNSDSTYTTPAAGTNNIVHYETGGTLTDPVSIGWVMFGDQ